jgi:hypothetical protein
MTICFQDHSPLLFSTPQNSVRTIALDRLDFDSWLTLKLSVEKLYLSDNQLSGLIPNGLWGMSNLVELSLASNVNLIGQIGSAIGNMVNLGKSTGLIPCPVYKFFSLLATV